MGIFIHITCDEERIAPELTARLVNTCPVDIFGQAPSTEGGRLVVRAEQVDECTLCELCLKLAPAGALIIHKLYKDERLTG